jgi:hypothetical protein
MNFRKIFAPIFFAFLFTACSDRVDFNRQQSMLRECTDNNAAECRAAEPGVPFKKIFVIDEQDRPKADILFVIDTSGSMRYEQEHIRQRFATFIDSLGDVDWRVGITTAIMRHYDEYPGTAGELIPFTQAPGMPSFLTPDMPNAREYFAQTIRRPKSCALKGYDDCDDHERAIYATNLLIARNNETHFFRPDTHVNIVIVSDEDENSNGTHLDALDIPETLVANAASLHPTSFTVHSIITRPGDLKCIKGQGENYGNIYAHLSQITGGVIGNVCDNDYTDQLKIIADTIQKKTPPLEIPCQLQEPPMVSTVPVLDASYSFQIHENRILFNKVLPGKTQVVVEGVCRPIKN